MTRVQVMFFRAIAVLSLGWVGACEEVLIPPSECAEGDASCEEDNDPVGCVCPAIYKPVCGENGKTYGNACEADCANQPIASEGECEAEVDAGPGCICPAIFQPVCGEDGKTYGNACEAGCADVPVAHEGECKDGGGDGGADMSCQSNADCTNGTICYPPTHQCQPECAIACLVYDPVCGTDGETYGCGAADAHCHGVEVASPGECQREPCACTKEYVPVCGADGMTYGNRCMAKCAGVEVAREGACGGGCTYGGQRYAAGASFPSDDGCNSCSCTDGGLVACTLRACACDYSDPARSWVARSARQCQTVKFTCVAGKRPFFNDCGCGCEADTVTCRTGGCSGQLCVGPGDPDISTCEWREEYACYRTATCEPQADGRCGWTQTDELRACIAETR